jgi:hypothetical protein
VATPGTEQRLLDVALAGTALHVEFIVRAWRRTDRVIAAKQADARHLSRHLTTWIDDDGMMAVRGRLTPEIGAVPHRAREARRPLPSGATCGGRRPGLHGALKVDDSAIRVSAEMSRRLACDAAVVEMGHDADGDVLDVGRMTRTIPTAIRRALSARDTRCQFPACSARRCDAHHIEHWVDGGPTSLDNLVLLCRRHQRFDLANPLAPTTERLDANGIAITTQTLPT